MTESPSSVAKTLLAGEIACAIIIVLPMVVLLNAPWFLSNESLPTFHFYLVGFMHIGLLLAGIAMFPTYSRAIGYLQARKVRHLTVYVLLLVFIPILIAAQADYARRRLSSLPAERT